MPFDPKNIDPAELRSVIEDARAEEEALYAVLGKKVFCAEAGKEDGTYAAEIEAIRTVKSTISLSEVLLAELTADKKVCPACGALVAPGAKFCSGCGAAVAAEEAVAGEPVCPACGKQLRAGARFCNACGTKI